MNFYSRPCGRGDSCVFCRRWYASSFLLTPLREGRHVSGVVKDLHHFISTHAPAGGATPPARTETLKETSFLLTPLREGRPAPATSARAGDRYFYSRPCGRGDSSAAGSLQRSWRFLLTPLREGRQKQLPYLYKYTVISTHAPAGGATKHIKNDKRVWRDISTHAPAGGATKKADASGKPAMTFLLTPLREGRPRAANCRKPRKINFYSRPCGRGDRLSLLRLSLIAVISTHAPAGGATAAKRASRRHFSNFYSRPCGRGDDLRPVFFRRAKYFYSRPCGRGD